MPRSYKICFLKKFDSASITYKKLNFGDQFELEGVEPGPSTHIFKSRDSVRSHDFLRYTIEHEVEESIHCRVNGKTYSKIIRMGTIDAFQSPSRNLLLLSGKKRDILDFCRRHSQHRLMEFTTAHVSMGELLQLLPSVKGVWFGFPSGQLKASALMGHNLEGTPDFKHYKSKGTISTLSFLFEASSSMHPVLVTDDGAIVLQGIYKSRSDEIDAVLDIKTKLLDKLLSEAQDKKRKTSKTTKETK